MSHSSTLEMFKIRFVASLDDVPVGAEILDAKETAFWRQKWSEAVDVLAQPDYDDLCRHFGDDPAESRRRAQVDISENAPTDERTIAIKVPIRA